MNGHESAGTQIRARKPVAPLSGEGLRTGLPASDRTSTE
jgi:hypothetical protein